MTILLQNLFPTSTCFQILNFSTIPCYRDIFKNFLQIVTKMFEKCIQEKSKLSSLINDSTYINNVPSRKPHD